MENKLSAIEWLEKELIKQGFLYDLDIEVAKDLHRKEIIKAYNDGIKNEISIYSTLGAEDYYNETYGKAQ